MKFIIIIKIKYRLKLFIKIIHIYLTSFFLVTQQYRAYKNICNAAACVRNKLLHTTILCDVYSISLFGFRRVFELCMCLNHDSSSSYRPFIHSSEVHLRKLFPVKTYNRKTNVHIIRIIYPHA